MILNRLEDFGRFVGFGWRATLAIPGVLFRRPGALPRQFERVGPGSLAIVAAAGVSIGMVTWLQTRRMLVSYGLEATLPSVLAAAVMVETGPILASLLVAGRMGAGLSAELGSMALAEEIEAREVLGSPTIPALIAPRVLACAVAVPMLVVVLDASAIVGGLVAEQTLGRLSAEVFGARTLDLLKLSDIVPATLKTGVFGWLIGLIACWTGLNAGRSTEAVGRAATTGVVRSMLAVFAADVLLVPWIQAFIVAMDW